MITNMAHSYIDCDRQQLFLLPPSMLDWLEEDDLAFFVIDAVGLIDTSAFHASHPNDGAGRQAYQPEMMLTLLLYAYCTGMRSSRAIERACRTDLAFKVITANEIPDHGTIARFRAEHEEPIKKIFVDVLGLCARAGMASLGIVAIDGTKIGSDAALDKNRRASWIRAEIEKILSEAADADSAEDTAVKLFDTDVLPEPLRRRSTRLVHLQRALKEAEDQEEAARAKQAEAAEKAATEASAGRKMRGRKPTDPHAALLRAEADLAASKVRAQSHPERADLARQVDAAEAALAQAKSAAAAAQVSDPDIAAG